MKICVKCRREMKCTKTGRIAHFGNGHCYSGDQFECPECKAIILIMSSTSYLVDRKDLLAGNGVLDMTEKQITCPKCKKTSYHPMDIKTGYCGKCHEFTGKKGDENE